MIKQESHPFKKAHIAVLIMGALFLMSGAFQSNLWFDEAYSAALTRHSFFEMLSIACQDVHPFLYYILLYPFTFLSGGSIVAARLFSVAGGIVLALTGFTHIRRYFGEKTGFFFTLFTFIFASTFKFSIEIRMYMWTAVFVTFAALYAWLCFQNGFKTKDAALFVLFCVMSAYSHYYGLITVCMINAVMLFSMLFGRRSKITSFLICAAAELALYIPGFIVFINQTSAVAQSDYWIRVKYPDVILETICYPFLGDTPKDTEMPEAALVFILVISIILYTAAIVKIFCMFRKDKKTAAPAVTALLLYIGIIAVALIASVWKDVFYVRYIMVMHGILIFIAAYLLAHINYKSAVAVLLSFAAMLAVRVPYMYQDIYSSENSILSEALDGRIRDDDILIYNDIMIGSLLSLRYPDNAQYLINSDMEDYPRAYLAFSPVMTTVRDTDEIEDLSGRVWIFDTVDGEDSAFEYIMNKYGNAKVISKREFADEKYRGIYFIYYLADITG